MNEQVSPIGLRNLLKQKGAYTIVPYPNGRGVRVAAGNIKHGPYSEKRFVSGRALYPERAIAPGGSSKEQRKWMVPIKYKVAEGTIERFRDLMDDALIARMDVEVAKRKARYAKRFADIEKDRAKRKAFYEADSRRIRAASDASLKRAGYDTRPIAERHPEWFGYK